MREWTRVKIGDLLAGLWPGEWGADPMADTDGAVVYRSTELDDDGHVHPSSVRRRIPEGKLASKKLEPGDVLLEASGGAPGRPVGRVGLYSPSHPEQAVCSNFLRTLRPNEKIHASFLRWVLAHLHRQPDVWRFQQQTTGMGNLNVRDYLRHEIGLPPREAQIRIDEILNTLDDAIEQTETLIAKTQQIRAGLMHDLFTRGVAPDGRLRLLREEAPGLYKQSTLGWLPKEWETSRIERHLVSSVDGPFGSNLKTEHYVSEPGVRLVRLQNIGVGMFLDDEKAWISEEHARSLAKHDAQPGDVLVASLGDPTHPFARSCLYPEGHAPGIVKADCFRLRMADTLEGSFLAYVLNTPRWRAGLSGLVRRSGVSRDRVNLARLRQVDVPLPPIAEQRELVAAMAAVEGRLSAENDCLRKLELRRLGLMHDLLTGRVRVASAEVP